MSVFYEILSHYIKKKGNYFLIDELIAIALYKSIKKTVWWTFYFSISLYIGSRRSFITCITEEKSITSALILERKAFHN